MYLSHIGFIMHEASSTKRAKTVILLALFAFLQKNAKTNSRCGNEHFSILFT